MSLFRRKRKFLVPMLYSCEDTDFIALGHNNSSWNVVFVVPYPLYISLSLRNAQVRSEFDHLLLNHARTLGAAVYEQTKVTEVHFSPDNPDRPVSVSWSHTPPSRPLSPPASPPTYGGEVNSQKASSGLVTGTTTFTHLIDATGRAGILSTRYLKNRYFNASLRNIAVWGYWTDVSTYGMGTPRQGAPYFEALLGMPSRFLNFFL